MGLPLESPSRLHDPPALAPRGRRPSGGDAQALRHWIEAEVLPRLRRRLAGTPSTSSRTPILSDADRDRFVEALTQRSAASAFAVAESLVARGVPRDEIVLELLPGSARLLGERWDDDQYHFVDVSIALCRLHEVLRRISDGELPDLEPPNDGRSRSVLLTTAGRDPHILGLLLVAERFRSAGWRTRVEPGAVPAEIVAEVERRDFDAVGISATRSTSGEVLAAEIGALRRAAREKRLVVLVGGRLFDEDPCLVEQVGADLSAHDAASAPRLCEEALREAEGADGRRPFRRG